MNNADNALDRDDHDHFLTDGERRILERAAIDEAQRARLAAYLKRRALTRRRIEDISESSFRSWLRRVLHLDIRKERSS